MISSALHLLACLALIAASIYWKIQGPQGDPIYRQMFPFIGCAGFFGIVILYGYFLELFVASYSGVNEEFEDLTRVQISWIAVSIFLTLLPLAGLIPAIGRHSIPLIVIGCLAALPGAIHLVSSSKDTK